MLSYGGSFLVLVLFALGVLESIWIHRKIHNGKAVRSKK
jgi:cell division protein FtsW (lipid II flippase)